MYGVSAVIITSIGFPGLRSIRIMIVILGATVFEVAIPEYKFCGITKILYAWPDIRNFQ